MHLLLCWYMQRRLAFPTSLPACSFVRIWADGILPDVEKVIVMDTNDEVRPEVSSRNIGAL